MAFTAKVVAATSGPVFGLLGRTVLVTHTGTGHASVNINPPGYRQCR